MGAKIKSFILAISILTGTPVLAAENQCGVGLLELYLPNPALELRSVTSDQNPAQCLEHPYHIDLWTAHIDRVIVKPQSFCSCLNDQGPIGQLMHTSAFRGDIGRQVKKIIENTIADNMRSQFFNKMSEALAIDNMMQAGQLNQSALVKVKSCYINKFLNKLERKKSQSDCDQTVMQRRLGQLFGPIQPENYEAYLSGRNPNPPRLKADDIRQWYRQLFNPVLANDFPPGVDAENSCLRYRSYTQINQPPLLSERNRGVKRYFKNIIMGNMEPHWNEAGAYRWEGYEEAFQQVARSINPFQLLSVPRGQMVSANSMALLNAETFGSIHEWSFDPQDGEAMLNLGRGFSPTNPNNVGKRYREYLSQFQGDPVFQKAIQNRQAARLLFQAFLEQRECIANQEESCQQISQTLTSPDFRKEMLEAVDEECKDLVSEETLAYFCEDELPNLSYDFVRGQVGPRIMRELPGQDGRAIASSLIGQSACRFDNDAENFSPQSPRHANRAFDNVIGNGFRRMSELEQMASGEPTNYQQMNEIVCAAIPECKGAEPDPSCGNPAHLKQKLCQHVRSQIGIHPEDNPERLDETMAHFLGDPSGNTAINSTAFPALAHPGIDPFTGDFSENSNLSETDLKTYVLEYRNTVRRNSRYYRSMQRYLNRFPGKLNTNCEFEAPNEGQQSSKLAFVDNPPFEPTVYTLDDGTEVEGMDQGLVTFFSSQALDDEDSSMAGNYIVYADEKDETQLKTYEQSLGKNPDFTTPLGDDVRPPPYQRQSPSDEDAPQRGGLAHRLNSPASGGLARVTPNPTRPRLQAGTQTPDDSAEDDVTSPSAPTDTRRNNSRNRAARAPASTSFTPTPAGQDRSNREEPRHNNSQRPQKTQRQVLAQDEQFMDRVKRINDQIAELESQLGRSNSSNERLPSPRRRQLEQEIDELRQQRDSLVDRVSSGRQHIARSLAQSGRGMAPIGQNSSPQNSSEGRPPASSRSEEIRGESTGEVETADYSAKSGSKKVKKNIGKEDVDRALSDLENALNGNYQSKLDDLSGKDKLDLLVAKAYADSKSKGDIEKDKDGKLKLPDRAYFPSFWAKYFVPHEWIEEHGLEKVVTVLGLYGKTFESWENQGQLIKIREYAFVPEDDIEYIKLYEDSRATMLINLVDNVIPRIQAMDDGMTQLERLAKESKLVKEVKYLQQDYTEHIEKWTHPKQKIFANKLK